MASLPLKSCQAQNLTNISPEGSPQIGPQTRAIHQSKTQARKRAWATLRVFVDGDEVRRVLRSSADGSTPVLLQRTRFRAVMRGGPDCDESPFAVITPAATSLRKAPMRVGRYEILEIIGAGANGSVVRAHDPLIGRLVAIKLLPPELAKGEAQNRFLQEARVVGQLSHPSIVTLHDMGIEESTQTPYLIMEYLDGQALEKILSKVALPLPKACAWASEVAIALGVAHRKGIIHGDVKPANILSTADERVKLTDF